MKNRSRTVILSEILQRVSENDGGCTKTKIMYEVELSYSQMKPYLGFIEKQNLLKHEEGTNLYTITEHGYRFLQVHAEPSKLVS